MDKQPITDVIAVPDIPLIPHLSFRHFRGEADYPDILAVRSASCEADQIEQADTLKDIARDYTILVNCDPAYDVLMAEVDGKVIGYCRVWWLDIVEGDRYLSFCGVSAARVASSRHRPCHAGLVAKAVYASHQDCRSLASAKSCRNR